jgi:Icc protein
MTFRLVQLTDLHLFADQDATLKGIPTRDCLLDVLQLIAAQETDCEHLIVTGDHTHDELPATYQDVRSLLTPWISGLHIVPGNHDDRPLMRATFPDVVPKTDPLTFSFECHDWHFIGLDSHCPGEVHGTLGPDQLDWFAGLVRSISRPIGVFMHHPPIAMNSPWMDRISLTDGSQMQQIVRDNSQIRFVSCGHVHHESVHRLETAEVLTTPSTGLQFNPAGDEPAFADEPPGYRVFEFDGAAFKTEVRRLSENRFHPDASGS